MKKIKKIAAKLFAAYVISSYIFFPLFILRYVDFKERTIFGDMGLQLGDIFWVIGSPFWAIKLGYDFLFYAPLEESYIKSTLYWIILFIFT